MPLEAFLKPNTFFKKVLIINLIYLDLGNDYGLLVIAFGILNKGMKIENHK